MKSIWNLAPEDFQAEIKAALALQFPYEDRRSRLPLRPLKEGAQGPVPAAVLLLFSYLSPSSELAILYTRRTDSVETHRGQMAFPGGHLEDQDQEDPVQAALRETHEEVGVLPDHVRVLGRLPELPTVTGFLIHPVVGLLETPYGDSDQHQLRPNSDEIAETVWVPLRKLIEPGIYRLETIAAGPVLYPIHVYQVDHHRIWGATASMTKNLLDRLQTLG